MNSITSPRSRPRARSVNFRALWWVVTREAVAEVLWPGQLLLRPGYCAYWLSQSRTYVLVRVAHRCIAKFPSRRFSQ